MSMEPSPETFNEVGRLCATWSLLEAMTEKTVWGILDADERLGPIITWRLDLRGRWQLILDHAPKKHNETDIAQLRSINKDITPVNRDRNIIVHGLVHATVVVEKAMMPGEVVPAGLSGPHNFIWPPCWTVFRGAEAGKNFPISAKAVEIVRTNIENLGERVLEFNIAHNYTARGHDRDHVEPDWPKPL